MTTYRRNGWCPLINDDDDDETISNKSLVLIENVSVSVNKQKSECFQR